MLQEEKFMLTNIYMLLMFLIFPLYVVDHYWQIGFYKWRFFLYVTLVYGVMMLVCYLPEAVACIRNRQLRRRITKIDIAVAIYGCSVLLSFLFAPDRQAAWFGTEGWYMGTAAQLLLIGVYFIISRSQFSEKLLLASSLGGLLICMLIGICQRLGWDIFQLYDGLDPGVLSDFLSTIGNRTWMSGYVCVVSPIAFYFFWKTDDFWEKLLWGLFCGILCAGISSTYSDSVYVGMTAAGIGLFLLGIGQQKRQISLLLLTDIWFVSALVMCLIRKLCGQAVRDARGVTSYVYQWQFALAGLGVCLLLTFFQIRFGKRKKSDVSPKQLSGPGKQIVKCVLILGILAAADVSFLVMNSTGLLEKWTGVTVANRYLYFDDAWGDNRGWTWRMVVEIARGLPLQQKLFGVGADCFAYYCYSHPVYSGEFVRMWQDTVLANAHNEWLNMLFCQGIFGGGTYLLLFACCGILFLKSYWSAAETTDKLKSSLVPAVGLSVLAYMGHNFFCYQQVCATAPMFILIGAGAACMQARN